jgi:beta-lactam-binding protein with PASTA domain
LTGLKAGKTIRKPSRFKNVILEQRKDGEPIKPGTYIAKGSPIDLVVSSGLGDQKVTVPDVVGQEFEKARIIIKGASLNVGSVTYRTNDSVKAVVYKQVPSASIEKKIPIGFTVDLYLGPKDSLPERAAPAK